MFTFHDSSLEIQEAMKTIPLLVLYATALALYIPALLTNYLGTYAVNFWDFYESTFVIIALLDFIPFMTIALSLKSDFLLLKVGFACSAAWMLIMAMPDIYMSYIPTLDQYYFADYRAWWFGNISASLLILNLILFAVINLHAKAKQ